MKKFTIDTSLIDAIGDTLDAGLSYKGKLKTEVIPVKKLVLDPQNARDLALGFEDLPDGPSTSDPFYERKLNEFEDLKHFAEEIKEDGVLQPIIVYEEGGKFYVIAGERRSLGSAIAGLNYIPAIVRSKPDEYNLSRIQWNENLQRKNLNLWERLQGIDRLLKGYISEVDPNAIASPSLIVKVANFSMSMAVDYFAILNGDQELLNAIKEQKIDNVKKAVQITKIKDPFAKRQALDACITGATLEEIENIATLDIQATPSTSTSNQKVSMPIKTAGRQATKVTLGTTTNTKAVKKIVELILNEPEFNDFRNKLDNINWEDYGQVSKLFNRVLGLLEKRVNK